MDLNCLLHFQVIKGGTIAWAQMGDPNASIPTPQPVYMRPMFGARPRVAGDGGGTSIACKLCLHTYHSFAFHSVGIVTISILTSSVIQSSLIWQWQMALVSDSP